MEKNNERRKEMEKNNEKRKLTTEERDATLIHIDLSGAYLEGMKEIKWTELKYSPEEDVEDDCESLSLPHGGVFKGDFASATKAQVRAANREWRRRKSTGRFSDDGSRWN